MRIGQPESGSPAASPALQVAADAHGEKGVALVTGGSRGVGRAVALGLGSAGFAVAVMARSVSELEETHALLKENAVPSMTCVADVADAAAVTRSVALVESSLGPITTLVNNAGTLLAIGPLWEIDPADWWTDIATSLGGTFNLCRSVIPRMISRGGGRILNVSSYAGARAAPYQTAYGCAKAGVTNLTESLAASLSAFGIRAFAITPGFVHTEQTRRLTESPEGQRWLPELQHREGLDLQLFVRLAVNIALGNADALNGRFLHALDEVTELLRRIAEIEEDDLYVLRHRRLPGR